VDSYHPFLSVHFLSAPRSDIQPRRYTLVWKACDPSHLISCGTSLQHVTAVGYSAILHVTGLFVQGLLYVERGAGGGAGGRERMELTGMELSPAPSCECAVAGEAATAIPASSTEPAGIGPLIGQTKSYKGQTSRKLSLL